jgi:hypothetical protein
MRNVFLYHIWVMYSWWFAAGVMLLAYIGYRRRRVSQQHSHGTASKTDATAAH